MTEAGRILPRPSVRPSRTRELEESFQRRRCPGSHSELDRQPHDRPLSFLSLLHISSPTQSVPWAARSRHKDSGTGKDEEKFFSRYN